MEERLNAITHGVGTTLAAAGLVLLIVYSCLYGNVWNIMSFSIYGSSLVLLYLASTLYHSFTNARLKSIFKVIDHSAIYLLIAGTYTPFALVLLNGSLGWAIFSIVWTVALVGIGFQVFFVNRFKIFSTACYVAMGWFIIFFIKPLVAVLQSGGLYWLITGGLLYTIGALFYLQRKIPYSHTVWHLFVLAGSASHFIAIFCYVPLIAAS